jgi:hypothetical protein
MYKTSCAWSYVLDMDYKAGRVLSALNDACIVLNIWHMQSLAQRERKEGYIRDIQ